MKIQTQNRQSIDITLTVEDVQKTDMDAEKIDKAFANNLIHIIRVPCEVYAEWQKSELKKLLYPHLQNKCKTVYYIETVDVNEKPTVQYFTPVYY